MCDAVYGLQSCPSDGSSDSCRDIAISEVIPEPPSSASLHPYPYAPPMPITSATGRFHVWRAEVALVSVAARCRRTGRTAKVGGYGVPFDWGPSHREHD